MRYNNQTLLITFKWLLFVILKVEMNLDLSEEEVHFMLDSVSHSCTEMIVQCKFGGFERDCMEIFSPIITDDGQCCSFNVMPEHVMFRNKEDHGTEEERRRWSGWHMHEGYTQAPNKGSPDCVLVDSSKICPLQNGRPPRLCLTIQ